MQTTRNCVSAVMMEKDTGAHNHCLRRRNRSTAARQTRVGLVFVEMWGWSNQMLAQMPSHVMARSRPSHPPIDTSSGAFYSQSVFNTRFPNRALRPRFARCAYRLLDVAHHPRDSH